MARKAVGVRLQVEQPSGAAEQAFDVLLATPGRRSEDLERNLTLALAVVRG